MELLLKKSLCSSTFLFSTALFTSSVIAETYNWVGKAVLPDTSLDSSLSAVDNWDLLGVPLSNANSHSILNFNGNAVLTGGYEVDIDLENQIYSSLSFGYGDFTLNGNAATLNRSANSSSVIDVYGSSNTIINNDISIVPYLLDGQLGSFITLDSASISTVANSTLALNGNINASEMDLSISTSSDSLTHINGDLVAKTLKLTGIHFKIRVLFSSDQIEMIGATSTYAVRCNVGGHLCSRLLEVKLELG